MGGDLSKIGKVSLGDMVGRHSEVRSSSKITLTLGQGARCAALAEHTSVIIFRMGTEIVTASTWSASRATPCPTPPQGSKRRSFQVSAHGKTTSCQREQTPLW